MKENDSFKIYASKDITENEDDGSVDMTVASSLKTVSGFITGLVLGPENEVSDLGQNPTYTLTTDNDGLFVQLPAIDALGILTYQPALNEYGSTVITILLNDNGGTDFGGDDEYSDTFTITVNPVNDEPYFTIGSNQENDEDSNSSDHDEDEYESENDEQPNKENKDEDDENLRNTEERKRN